MSLFVETSGRGQDVVLLHGWAMNSSVWQPVVEVLSQEFCVHAVDLPGHGQSPMLEPYSLAQIVAELQQSFPWPAHVVGWSLGGAVASQWALTCPDQVRSLTLVASSPCFMQRPEWLCATAPEVLAQFATQLQTDWKGTLKRFIGLQVLGDAAARAVARTLTHELFQHGEPALAALASGLALLRDTDLRGQMADLCCPVLLQYGDRDALTPQATGQWLAKTIPDARLVMHAGAAHVPFISHPDAFNAALLEFLLQV